MKSFLDNRIAKKFTETYEQSNSDMERNLFLVVQNNKVFLFQTKNVKTILLLRTNTLESYDC